MFGVEFYVLLSSGVYLITIAFFMETKNLRSTIVFNTIPLLLGIFCVSLVLAKHLN